MQPFRPPARNSSHLETAFAATVATLVHCGPDSSYSFVDHWLSLKSGLKIVPIWIEKSTTLVSGIETENLWQKVATKTSQVPQACAANHDGTTQQPDSLLQILHQKIHKTLFTLVSAVSQTITATDCSATGYYDAVIDTARFDETFPFPTPPWYFPDTDRK